MLSFTISINLHKLYIKIIIKERLSCQLNHEKNAISISFFVCLTINGQQIKQSSNHYHNGDILEKKQVFVESFEQNSKNGLWSLEDAEVSNKTIMTKKETFKWLVQIVVSIGTAILTTLGASACNGI